MAHAEQGANPQDARFSDRFLIVTPGITIRDRLRVVLPSDPGNYYRERDLVPADLVSQLGRARIVITNFHTFMQRETKAGKAARLTKSVLNPDGSKPFLETPDQMARRVCRDLGAGRNQIVVLNDEAHHCYARRPVDGPAEDGVEVKLTGDEKREADIRDKEAMVWVSGLQAINAKLGVKIVYDLSATPFFLAGSGYAEGKLFPWVVSDFSLTDAVECGIVKIPAFPWATTRCSAMASPTGTCGCGSRTSSRRRTAQGREVDDGRALDCLLSLQGRFTVSTSTMRSRSPRGGSTFGPTARRRHPCSSLCATTRPSPS